MTRHLGPQISAYVDRALPGSMLRVLDRHVVVCVFCRAAADHERQMLSMLRADLPSGPPDSLRSLLVALSHAPSSEPANADSGFGRPAPLTPVPVVAPGAAPRYRSPMRAVLLAGFAAGAASAAAWSLAASPVPSAKPAVRPASSPVSPARPPVGGSAALVSVLGGRARVAGAGSTTVGAVPRAPAVVAPRVRRADSDRRLAP